MTDQAQTAMPQQDSADPMRLRADPPRVTRLSRKALLTLTTVAALGLGGALIYALQSRDRTADGEELYSTEYRQPAEGVNTLPSDYTGPVLGPPLPGDLGRPILDAQNRGQTVAPPVMTLPAADPDAERRLAEEEAARTSGVFFQTARSAAPTAGSFPTTGLGSAAPTQTTPQSGNQSFLSATTDRRTVAPDRVMAPASPYLLQAGAVIPAALVTGIRSDLPGQIAAQVTQNVYDSPSGSILLIPQGTRLIGEYSDDVSYGQRRILLVWTRLILPNGRSLVLERLPGADAQGYAGLEDGVDYHGWELLRAAGFSTLLAIGAELGSNDDDPLVEAIREGAQSTIGNAGQEIVRRQIGVPPTLTIRPGHLLRVIVTRDLILEPYR